MHTGKKTHRQGHIYMPTHTHMCSKKTESSQSENEKSLVLCLDSIYMDSMNIQMWIKSQEENNFSNVKLVSADRGTEKSSVKEKSLLSGLFCFARTHDFKG